MGTTARVCITDEENRPVFDDESRAELGLEDDGFLDLDQSWSAIETMISSVVAGDFTSEDGVDADDVARLAKALRPLTWENALATCEAPEDDDLDYVEPYFESFRELVLAAAAEANGIRWEFL